VVSAGSMILVSIISGLNIAPVISAVCIGLTWDGGLLVGGVVNLVRNRSGQIEYSWRASAIPGRKAWYTWT